MKEHKVSALSNDGQKFFYSETKSSSVKHASEEDALKALSATFKHDDVNGFMNKAYGAFNFLRGVRKNCFDKQGIQSKSQGCLKNENYKSEGGNQD